MLFYLECMEKVQLTEKELDTVLQMTVEQSTKWTAIVTNINKCV